jgi:hypothetical protein
MATLNPRKLALSALLALLLLVCLVPAYLTATPKQCAGCHEMEPYYESWKASSHRGAATHCLQCHAEPGIFGLALYEAGFWGEIVAHLQGAEVAVGAGAPSPESCQRDACHSLNREASYSGDLRIDHREHVTSEHITCPECHPGAVHEGVGGLEMTPPMESCKRCHEDDMEDCDYCHTGKVVPQAPDTH